VKVAKLYYFVGMTQAEIARKIGVSRPIVSKMLTKAREDKIVEIFIKDESAHTVDLVHQLEKQFALQEALVLPRSDHAQQEQLSLLGQAAAAHESKRMDRVNCVGISWGNAVSAFVNAYPFEKNEAVHVVPLIGGIGRSEL